MGKREERAPHLGEAVLRVDDEEARLAAAACKCGGLARGTIEKIRRTVAHDDQLPLEVRSAPGGRGRARVHGGEEGSNNRVDRT